MPIYVKYESPIQFLRFETLLTKLINFTPNRFSPQTYFLKGRSTVKDNVTMPNHLVYQKSLVAVNAEGLNIFGFSFATDKYTGKQTNRQTNIEGIII